jgi:Carboxypeptidase regulatory-like domain/TonB-dependent Receptor Plug Domain
VSELGRFASVGQTLILLCLLPGFLHAQVGAVISGRVEDASGGAIRGATVTVKNLETGAASVVTTEDKGNFSALSLAVGPYEVKVVKSGFKAIVRSRINLEVGQNAVVNFQLLVGDFVQQLTVAEDVPVVNATTASVSGMVGERQVKDLPLNGRSFDDLITLNPGAINYSAMKSANTSTSDGNTFSVAGRRTGENLLLLNGIEYTGASQLAVTPGGVSGYLLGIDAVREFNVLTDTYPAEYGKRAGAQIMLVTQSNSEMSFRVHSYATSICLSDERLSFLTGVLNSYRPTLFHSLEPGSGQSDPKKSRNKSESASGTFRGRKWPVSKNSTCAPGMISEALCAKLLGIAPSRSPCRIRVGAEILPSIPAVLPSTSPGFPQRTTHASRRAPARPRNGFRKLSRISGKAGLWRSMMD